MPTSATTELAPHVTALGRAGSSLGHSALLVRQAANEMRWVSPAHTVFAETLGLLLSRVEDVTQLLDTTAAMTARHACAADRRRAELERAASAVASVIGL